MITIKYQNSDLFSGVAYTPLISLDQSFNYSNRFLSGYKKITLTGRLIRNPRCGTWAEYQDVQKVLLDRLRTNFGKLEVYEVENNLAATVNSLFSCERAIYRSLSFDESAYYNLVPFTLEFDCYDDFFLSNGVVDASDEATYQENDNRTVSITRNISATAVNTGPTGTAIEYAKAFVENRISSDINRFPNDNPLFADVTLAKSKLISIERRVDRLQGTYSANLNFLCDPYNASNSSLAVLNYSVETSEQNDEVIVSINGTMTGGIDKSISSFRSVFNGINWYSKAISYTDYSISDNPKSFSVTEDNTTNTINFTISYSNKVRNDVYLIDTTSITKDFESNIDCISVKLDIKYDYGTLSERWDKVLNYYNTQQDYIKSFIAAKWAEFGNGKPLGRVPKSKSVSMLQQNGTISLSEQYCTDTSEDCGCLEMFTYTMNFVPSIDVYVETPGLQGEGCYYIQNLQYNKRAKFSINGSFRPSKCCTIEESISDLKSRLNFYCSYYFQAENKVLEEDTVDYQENASEVSFQFSWSGKQENYIPSYLK
jgi:hypothetical protein